MYEQPTKGDLDRNLSIIMHEARRKSMAERGRIFSEAAAQGALTSRVPVIIADAVDTIQRDAIDQAMIVVRNFMERMQLPPREITGWARPHLENLGNVVLGSIHPAGYPGAHQQVVRQYGAVFQQRLDGALRDAEIGFVKDAGFAATPALNAGPGPKQPIEIFSLKPTWLGMGVDLKALWRRIRS